MSERKYTRYFKEFKLETIRIVDESDKSLLKD